jgi:hypothetical protein
MKKFVDLSGYVYSGKSAISDILREIDGFIVPASEEEFDLLRIPNGLIDLKNSVNDWSPIRTYAAFERFKKLSLGVGIRWRFPFKYFRHGLDYQSRYPNYFKYLQIFLNEISYRSWITPWTYSHFNDGPVDTFKRKVSEKFGYIKLRHYTLIDKKSFLPAAQKFVSELLWLKYGGRAEHTLVTHNALEPFSPHLNADLLSNSKCIVVDRDPRDIYATAQIIPPGQSDKLNRYRNMCAGHDVETFIKRYQLYRSLVIESPNVLRLDFADIILNYEETLTKIYNFLEIDPKFHTRKLQSFNPKISQKSYELYKSENVKRFTDDFKTIAKELKL